MIIHSWHDKHMIRTVKSILKDLYILLGTFIFIFVLSHIGGVLYVSSTAQDSVESFQSGIESDKKYLKMQGDIIAQDDTLITNLLDKDYSAVLEITKKEREDRNIGLIGVANSKGVIISRTLAQAVPGQNVFLTVPAGRVVSQGQSIESVELTGFGGQVFVTTARPIYSDDEMVGALFANYLMDNKYAIDFRDKYLSKGEEVVFYSKEFGIYGSSFSDTETHKLIDSYFNSGSQWIKNGQSDKTIFLKKRGYYYIKNITFPGLEESPGGAIIFIPRIDISYNINLLVVFIIASIFIFCTLRRHYLKSRGEEYGWRYYILLFIVLIPVTALVFLTFRIQNSGYLKLERIPHALYNSTLRLQPEFGIYDMGFEQRFSIIIDTGDESINSASIGVLFDSEIIEVKAIDIASTTCSYVIENTINNIEGRANLACVLLKSDNGRGSFKIADVVVVPKRAGTFTLSFDDEESKILADDGVGTNVLRFAQSGSYRVDEFDSNVPFGDGGDPSPSGEVKIKETHGKMVA